MRIKAFRSNISYLFIPFSMKSPADYRSVVQKAQTSHFWKPAEDELLYLYKFVADKLDPRDDTNCRCFHFHLTDDKRDVFGLDSPDTWLTYNSTNRDGKVTYSASLQIPDVQLYCFSTGVCILAIAISFHTDDLMKIANAQYYIKKVGRGKVHSEAAPDGFSFMTLARNMTGELGDFDYFFYANPDTERANFLTCVEHPGTKSIHKELHYLRWCNGESYTYSENPERDQRESHQESDEKIWGISPEAAVCVLRPDMGNKGFLRGTFFENFNNQYLYMYVLLLHQKYELYNLLTRIGVGRYNDLKKLEEYRKELFEFETDFVFSRITEVPQYQVLYNKISAAFALKDMYTDVREPLVSLSEERRQESDKKQKAQDERTNKSLAILSVITLVSTFTDMYSLLGGYLAKLPEATVALVQDVVLGLMLIPAAYIVYSLFIKKD